MAAPFVLASRFPEYVWSGAFLAIEILAVALVISVYFLWRGEVLRAVVIKVAGLAMMIAAAGFGMPDKLDREMADQYLNKIVSNENYQGQPIVSGKLYCRGIHFHTGNPVIVWDRDAQPFWSAHPVRVISTEDRINEFFSGRPRVICVIKPEYVEDLNRIFKDRRANRVITRDGKKAVVVSDRI